MEKVVVAFEIPKDQIKTINTILKHIFSCEYSQKELINVGFYLRKKKEVRSIAHWKDCVKTVNNITDKFEELARNQELEANP
jgi:methyl coenzyme M reductase subunit D